MDIDVDVSGVPFHLYIFGLNRQILFLCFVEYGLPDLFTTFTINTGIPRNILKGILKFVFTNKNREHHRGRINKRH